MVTIKCRNGQSLDASLTVLCRWKFVARIFDSQIKCEEVKSGVIDLGDYLSYCAALLIHTCLSGDLASMRQMIAWSSWHDVQDLKEKATISFLGLDDPVFLPLSESIFVSETPGVGMELSRMLYFLEFVLHPNIINPDAYSPSSDFPLHGIRYITKRWQPDTFLRDAVVNAAGLSTKWVGILEGIFQNLNQSEIGLVPTLPTVANYILHKEYFSKLETSTLETLLLQNIGKNSIAKRLFLSLCRDPLVLDLVRNNDDCTSLHIACTLGRLETVCELLQLDPNLCTIPNGASGVLPIHIAAMTDNLYIFAKVLMATVDAFGTVAANVCKMQCRQHGWTPAHYALIGASNQNSNCQVLKWLLDHECAFPEIADSSGKTIKDYAVEKSFGLAIRLIEENTLAPSSTAVEVEYDNISWHEDESDVSLLEDEESE